LRSSGHGWGHGSERLAVLPTRAADNRLPTFPNFYQFGSFDALVIYLRERNAGQMRIAAMLPQIAHRR
jgi:hypothetical protein